MAGTQVLKTVATAASHLEMTACTAQCGARRTRGTTAQHRHGGLEGAKVGEQLSSLRQNSCGSYMHIHTHIYILYIYARAHLQHTHTRCAVVSRTADQHIRPNARAPPGRPASGVSNRVADLTHSDTGLRSRYSLGRLLAFWTGESASKPLSRLRRLWAMDITESAFSRRLHFLCPIYSHR